MRRLSMKEMRRVEMEERRSEVNPLVTTPIEAVAAVEGMLLDEVIQMQSM